MVLFRCLPQDAYAINKLCSDLTTMTDALCELRQDGKGATPQAESLARGKLAILIITNLFQQTCDLLQESERS